jgi:hypothetical protein
LHDIVKTAGEDEFVELEAELAEHDATPTA